MYICTYFVKFIPKYFIFPDDLVSGIILAYGCPTDSGANSTTPRNLFEYWHWWNHSRKRLWKGLLPTSWGFLGRAVQAPKLVQDSLSEWKGRWLWFLLWLGSRTRVRSPGYGLDLQDLSFLTDSEGRHARAFLLTCPDMGQEGWMGLENSWSDTKNGLRCFYYYIF